MVMEEDGDLLDEIVRADERWIAAVKARGLKPDDVQIDYWAVGTVPDPYKGRRLLRGLSYFQGDAANFYGQPIEGIDARLSDRFARGDVLFDCPFRTAQGLGPVFVRAACAGCNEAD